MKRFKERMGSIFRRQNNEATAPPETEQNEVTDQTTDTNEQTQKILLDLNDLTEEEHSVMDKYGGANTLTGILELIAYSEIKVLPAELRKVAEEHLGTGGFSPSKALGQARAMARLREPDLSHRSDEIDRHLNAGISPVGVLREVGILPPRGVDRNSLDPAQRKKMDDLFNYYGYRTW